VKDNYVDRFTTIGDVQAAPNRGWRVSGVDNDETASETWYVKRLIFYEDSKCISPLDVSKYYDYIVPFSSHGNPMIAFDPCDGRSWRIPSSHYTYREDWHIGFYFTEEEFPPAVRCVEIYLENEDPMVTTTNMRIALEKLYQDSYRFSSPQEHEWKLLYEVRGLESGSNVISFSETCIASDVTLRYWGDSICDEEFNHATCLYDDGDCEDNFSTSPGIVALIAAILAVVTIIVFKLVRRHNQRHNGQSQPVTPLSVPTPAVQNINEDREARRERILLSIIHKQVLSQPSKENQSSIENDNLSTTEQDHEKEEQEEGEEKANAEPTIILPHEESLSSRYLLRVAPKTDEEAQTPISTTSDDSVVLKDDLYVKSLRSMRENSSRIVVNNDVEDSLYSPKVCPICCEEYKKGDDIAWSKNESCYHAYHVDCIMEWLMDHDDCPLCREKYIEL